MPTPSGAGAPRTTAPAVARGGDRATAHPGYRLLFRTVFRRMDPERAHHLAFGAMRAAARVPLVRRAVSRVLAPRPAALRVQALGLDLPGPLGLAAGFDKNATGIDALTMAGFDFVEV